MDFVSWVLQRLDSLMPEEAVTRSSGPVPQSTSGFMYESGYNFETGVKVEAGESHTETKRSAA
jgi:hypothetical protein